MSPRVRERLAIGLAAFCLLLVAAPAAAVILAGVDGSANTEPPLDDFGFANVGVVKETAVYLGNGWMITANHVADGPVRFRDRLYPNVEGSKRRLASQGSSVSPDVAVFRLREPIPDLPALPIRSTPPIPGDLVVLAGNGPNRGEATEFEGHRGWRWGRGKALRWGTNRVHALHRSVQATRGDDTVAFSTRFSEQDPTEHEATVAIGDSGGGAFIRNGDRWELAGILFAASTHDDQPKRTTLFGNITYAADLSLYREEVLAIAGVPACRDGLDDDGDGLVDFPEDPGCGHADDRNELSACEPGPKPGDADGNGVVDGNDYVEWTRHQGRYLPGSVAADFDCDGLVGSGDFAVWHAAYRAARADAARESGCGQGFGLAAAILPVLVWRGKRLRPQASACGSGRQRPYA